MSDGPFVARFFEARGLVWKILAGMALTTARLFVKSTRRIVNAIKDWIGCVVEEKHEMVDSSVHEHNGLCEVVDLARTTGILSLGIYSIIRAICFVPRLSRQKHTLPLAEIKLADLKIKPLLVVHRSLMVTSLPQFWFSFSSPRATKASGSLRILYHCSPPKDRDQESHSRPNRDPPSKPMCICVHTRHDRAGGGFSNLQLREHIPCGCTQFCKGDHTSAMCPYLGYWIFGSVPRYGRWISVGEEMGEKLVAVAYGDWLHSSRLLKTFW